MNVLVLAPHPDDEVLGCGGTIAWHSSRGDSVYVAIITRGIPELWASAQIEQTRQEMRKAHSVLGVSETRFLDFPAPRLDIVPGYQIADAVSGIVRELQPQILYLPYGNDIHSDHQAVYRAGTVAARPLPGCPIRKVLCYETLSETEWASPLTCSAFTANVYVDISKELELKLEAMRCYHTQLHSFPSSRSLECIEALARFRGGTVGVAAAEGFALVRELIR